LLVPNLKVGGDQSPSVPTKPLGDGRVYKYTLGDGGHLSATERAPVRKEVSEGCNYLTRSVQQCG